MFRIFLIRHGESMQNTGENYEIKLPDNKVYLTNKGEEQANECGKFLKEYIEKENIDISNATLWISSYKRAVQTAEIINEHLNISKKKKDFLLIEQQYGLFSDNPLEECRRKFPNEFEYYNRLYQQGGKFFAKLPQGESPYDVAVRTRLFFETIFRDLINNNDTLFIVTHGRVIQCFRMAWFHYDTDWFDNEITPDNCSISYIERNELNEPKSIDYQYIYGSGKKR